ncbi:MAG: response regulator [Patescibacteria group bacterium]
MTEQPLKKLLLLIEDNPLLIGMYKAAFEKAGIDVLLAHDGEKGLTLAKEQTPDLIVLDLLMPGMDGLEILKRLRDDPTTKELKIVVLTIVARAEAEEHARRLGVLDYLVKSELKLHEIVERIIQLLYRPDGAI